MRDIISTKSGSISTKLGSISTKSGSISAGHQPMGFKVARNEKQKNNKLRMVIMKFGGTSVGSAARMNEVANLVLAENRPKIVQKLKSVFQLPNISPIQRGRP